MLGQGSGVTTPEVVVELWHASTVEEYGLISDLRSGALITQEGQHRLAMPAAVRLGIDFRSLARTADNGRWLLAPACIDKQISGDAVADRHYLPSAFIIETRWRTASGEVLVTEFMPIGGNGNSVIRRVQGVHGQVLMRQELELRFGYGKVVPWVRRIIDDDGEALLAVAGPHSVMLTADVLPRAVLG